MAVFVSAAGTGATSAETDPVTVSAAESAFLSGYALETEFDSEDHGGVLAPSTAQNPSGPYPLVTRGISADAVAELGIGFGGGVLLFGQDGYIQLDDASQYAEARDDGGATAATGAVSDTGQITGAAVPRSGITLDFSDITDSTPRNWGLRSSPDTYTSSNQVLDELILDIGSVASRAEQVRNYAPQSHYILSDADIQLSSALVHQAFPLMLAQMMEDRGLDWEDLEWDHSRDIADLLVDGQVSAGANLETGIGGPEDVLPQGPLESANGVAITFGTHPQDEDAGRVGVDLDTLIDSHPDFGDLGDLPPNSSLFDGPVGDAVQGGIGDALQQGLHAALLNMREAIDESTWDITVNLDLASQPAAVFSLQAVAAEIAGGEAVFTVDVHDQDRFDQVLEERGSTQDQLGTEILEVFQSYAEHTLTMVENAEEWFDDGVGSVTGDITNGIFEVINSVAQVRANVQPETGDLGEGSFTVRALSVELSQLAVGVNSIEEAPSSVVNIASSTVYGTGEPFAAGLVAQPEEVFAEETVQLEGHDYRPESRVDIEILDHQDHTAALIPGVLVDENGHFTQPWHVPSGTEPGRLGVTATDSDYEEISASTEVLVLAVEDDGSDTGTGPSPSPSEDPTDSPGTEDPNGTQGPPETDAASPSSEPSPDASEPATPEPTTDVSETGGVSPTPDPTTDASETDGASSTSEPPAESPGATTPSAEVSSEPPPPSLETPTDSTTFTPAPPAQSPGGDVTSELTTPGEEPPPESRSPNNDAASETATTPAETYPPDGGGPSLSDQSYSDQPQPDQPEDPTVVGGTSEEGAAAVAHPRSDSGTSAQGVPGPSSLASTGAAGAVIIAALSVISMTLGMVSMRRRSLKHHSSDA